MNEASAPSPLTSNGAHDDWYRRRVTMEQGGEKSTPDGFIPFRAWTEIGPILRSFEPLLRYMGLHGRGLANALDIRINPVSVQLPALPPAFDGYQILQISDTHLDGLPALAPIMARLLQGIEVDMLLLTGDYREDHKDPPDVGLELLRPIVDAIKSRDGRFALLGNHDPACSVPALQAMRFSVLLNQTICLHRDDQTVHVTGLDDVHYFYTDTARAALVKPFDGCRIAAVHSAEAANLAADASFDLYLCGHTHGGQVCLPGGRPLLTRLHRNRAYACGLWRHGAMRGYTTTGAWVSSLPVRFFCPPEMALITLHRGTE